MTTISFRKSISVLFLVIETKAYLFASTASHTQNIPHTQDIHPVPSPLTAVRTAALFPPFSPPRPSSLSAGQQRLVSAARVRRRETANGNRPPPQSLATSRTPTHHEQVERGLVCAIIPFSVRSISIVEHETYVVYLKPSPKKNPAAIFNLDADRRRRLLPELISYKLVFQVDTSNKQSEDEIWQVLNDQVIDHLAANRIQMSSINGADPYLSLGWTLCRCYRQRYKADMPESYHCTIAHVRNIAHPHPQDRSSDIFFIGEEIISQI